MIKIDGKTKVFGVIADPIEHVKATEIYNNRWLFKDKNYVMVPIHVLPSNLDKVLKGLKSTANFHGLCVCVLFLQFVKTLPSCLVSLWFVGVIVFITHTD